MRRGLDRNKIVSEAVDSHVKIEVQTAASRQSALQLLESVPLSEWQDLLIPEAALFVADLAESLLGGWALWA